MHTTRALAEYVCGMDAASLPAEAREAALRCVLDLMAAAVAGYRVPSVAGTRRVVGDLYASGQAPVWFSGRRMTAAGAALCNSAAASVLDLDDGNRAARGHPGAAVIPAAFAAAAEVGATADELLTAIVAGYEVGVRIAAARNPANTHSRQSGRWTGYAAAAAAGRLRGITPSRMSQAFSIAGVTAPNQEANGSSGYSRLTGNDVKEGIPWSTVTGFSALHLAVAGLTGPEDILDHESHFFGDRILDGLGRKHAISATYFKPYSCCRYNHCAIDAFNAVMSSHDLSAADVAAVEVQIFGWALKLGNLVEPKTLVDVQYSIPYCIGLVAIMGSDAMVPIDETVLDRPEVSAFARRVTLTADPSLDERFPEETLARVIVTTKKGRFESPVTTPRGEPSNPMSWKDLQQKFRVATRHVLATDQQQAMIDAIDRLREGDAAPLTDCLASPIESRNTRISSRSHQFSQVFE